MFGLPNATAKGNVRRLMSDRFGGAFSSSEFNTMVRTTEHLQRSPNLTIPCRSRTPAAAARLAEGCHYRTVVFSVFSGRAIGHRRLADGWPIGHGFATRQLGYRALCRGRSPECASVTGGGGHVHHVIAHSFFRRLSRSSPNAVSIWHV
jgi:hypothetical protein